jgi:hypothetical protein
MVGRTQWQSTESGHVRPRMTGGKQQFRVSDWRYCFAAQNLYPDIS